MILRAARLEDIPHLPGIERSAAESFRGTAQAWIADDSIAEAEAYPPLIAAGGVWVVERDHLPRGFIQTTVEGHDLHIWELSVHGDWQRQGLGAALIRTAVNRARASGLVGATLTTFREIPWNAPFYARLGFQVLETPELRLATILAAEAARGLTDRCAMRLEVAGAA